MGDSVPAFLTMVMMPFTYSIADGLIGGICSYMIINTTIWLVKVASGGRILPPNYEDREGWTLKIPGGVFPPWMKRLARGKKDFWRNDDQVTDAVSQGSSGDTVISLGDAEKAADPGARTNVSTKAD